MANGSGSDIRGRDEKGLRYRAHRREAPNRTDSSAGQRLAGALERIEEAERRWAELARSYGYAAVAREMGLTPEAVRKRVLKILGPP